MLTATIYENQPWSAKVGTIVSAAWGSDKQAYVVGSVIDTGLETDDPIYYDVTSKVQGLVVDGGLTFAPSIVNMGYDPAKGETKKLYLTYMPPTNMGTIINDGAFSFAITTEDWIDNSRVLTFHEGASVFDVDFGTIVSATYGWGGNYLDVSALIKSYSAVPPAGWTKIDGGGSSVTNTAIEVFTFPLGFAIVGALNDEKATAKLGKLTYQGSPYKYQPFIVNNYNMGGDPAPGKAKTLTVHSIFPTWTQIPQNQQVNLEMSWVGTVMYGPRNHYAADLRWFTNRLYTDSAAGDPKNTDAWKVPLKYEIPGGYQKYLDVTSVARPHGVHGWLYFLADDNLVADPDHGQEKAISITSYCGGFLQ